VHSNSENESGVRVSELVRVCVRVHLYACLSVCLALPRSIPAIPAPHRQRTHCKRCTYRIEDERQRRHLVRVHLRLLLLLLPSQDGGDVGCRLHDVCLRPSRAVTGLGAHSIEERRSTHEVRHVSATPQFTPSAFALSASKTMMSSDIELFVFCHGLRQEFLCVCSGIPGNERTLFYTVLGSEQQGNPTAWE
jgi:hypothetical protein